MPEEVLEVVTPTYTYTVTTQNLSETVTIVDENDATEVLSVVSGHGNEGSTVRIDSVTYTNS